VHCAAWCIRSGVEGRPVGGSEEHVDQLAASGDRSNRVTGFVVCVPRRCVRFNSGDQCGVRRCLCAHAAHWAPAKALP
jgi:hypothetical protein